MCNFVHNIINNIWLLYILLLTTIYLNKNKEGKYLKTKLSKNNDRSMYLVNMHVFRDPAICNVAHLSSEQQFLVMNEQLKNSNI